MGSGARLGGFAVVSLPRSMPANMMTGIRTRCISGLGYPIDIGVGP
ncbi:hypothetical protein P3T22_000679 [Paraburkholderia sp. GAS348]